MNHKLFKSQISEYIDKRLSAGELVEFDRHAKECPSCLLELQMTIKAVKEIQKTEAKELDLPVNFYAKLGCKLDKADAEKIKRKDLIYTPWFRAAALSFALILTVVMARQTTKSSEPAVKMKAVAPKPALADMQKDAEAAMPVEEKNAVPETYVIRDEATWKAYAPGNALNPDFSRQMVLYVSLSQRPSAGYSVEFADIKYETNKIIVYVKEIKPKQNSLTAQVITSPVGVKVINRSVLPVEFVFIK